MTIEEYIIKKLLDLELENKKLKEENEILKEMNNVVFKFDFIDMPKGTYKVECENENVKISRDD